MNDHIKQPVSMAGENSEKKHKRRRFSLVTIFSGSFFSVVLLFLIVNAMVVYRFLDFQTILSQLTVESLPEITLSGRTYSKVNELTYLTERLSSSPSQAFRRIAYQNIQEAIKQINEIGVEKNKDEFLKAQLKAIATEFYGLNQLIEKRIQLHILVDSQQTEIVQLQEAVRDLLTINNESIANKPVIFNWAFNFSEIVSFSREALVMSRLSRVRQISSQLEERLGKLIINSKNVEFLNGANAEDLTRKLKTTLILEDGLLPLRIQELRSIGQAIGRSNFVRNLVVDYARQVQFYSYAFNDEVIKKTEFIARQINVQTKIIGLTAIFAFFVLLGIVYFLQRKIIKRLVNLNLNVMNRIEGEELHLNLGGNDEISDIAHSFNSFVKEIENQNQKLHALSLTDGLTGIANRRYLDERLMTELQLAKRHKWPVSVLILDVDSFKAFNDHYGHLAGDDCLKAIAETLKNCQQRESDFVARFGGEEFVFILPDTSLEGAEQVSTTILNAITSLKITHEWNPASPFVTVSIGIATSSNEAPISDVVLLERADKALFKAKAKGKNCFVSFDDSSE